MVSTPIKPNALTKHPVRDMAPGKRSVDLVEMLEREVYPQVTPQQIYSWSGHNFKVSHERMRGCPPFRESKSGTSFTVFNDLGFLDAGDGGETGDPVKYLYSMKIGRYAYPKGKDWIDTVKELFDLAGVSFPEKTWTPEELKKAQRREIRQTILKVVEDYCVESLWSARGLDAREHLISERGFTEAALREFGIGFYPTVNEVREVLQARGLDLNLAQGVGVLASKWEGYCTFPWFNPYSQPLTLYGHMSKTTAEVTGKPKKYALFNPRDDSGAWLHTKESPYLLNRVIRARHKEVVLVEGITDAAIAHQEGDTRVIACVAAQLSSDQAQTLARHGIERVFILLDPDSAGEKGIDSCIKSLTVVGITPYVAPKLPDELDPDEFLLRDGLEVWRSHINAAEHGFRWKAQQLIKAGNPNTDKGKEEILKQAHSFTHSIKGSKEKSDLQVFFWPEICESLGVNSNEFIPTDNSGNGGNGSDDSGNEDDGSGGNQQPNHWTAPVSWNGEIGWLVPTEKPVTETDPETGEEKQVIDEKGRRLTKIVMVFFPKCNFDFQIEQELSSVDREDGGGIVLQVKRSIDDSQKRVIIKSVDYGSAKDFETALKKALGDGIVINLKSEHLKSLIHVRLREYRERGGRKYRLCDRIGQQEDGTWVFADKQFTKDGQPTTQEESGWIYNPQVSPTDTFFCPEILEENPKALRNLIEAQKKVGGSNFMRFLLCDGYVAACLNEQTIVKTEGFMPILNPYGDPGGGKTVGAESALSLIWGTSDKSGMCSASESYLYERLSRYGSIPSLWDDPPSKRREDKEKLDELIKRNYGKFARKVRGSDQHPHSSFIPTTNHATGDTLPATKSRGINLFFPVVGDMKFEHQPELEDAKAKATGAFRQIINIGYDRAKVRELRARLQKHLPTAHDRAAIHLAILTWYTQNVVDLAGMGIDVEAWVIQNLCPELNEAQTGLNSVADFVERFIAAKSTSAIGTWNFGLVKTAEQGNCLAIHMPSVWPVIESGDPPPYNRSVLERVLVEKGAIKNKPAKLDRDRDTTLAHQREIHKGRNEGEDWVAPSKPKPVNKKCLLIPERLWGDLGFLLLVPDSPPDDDGGGDSELVTSSNLEVTSSNLDEVTACQLDESTVSANVSLSGNLVTKKNIVQEKNEESEDQCDNSSSTSLENKIDPLQNQVTEVTGLPESENRPESLKNTSGEVVTNDGGFKVTEGEKEVTSLKDEAEPSLSENSHEPADQPPLAQGMEESAAEDIAKVLADENWCHNKETLAEMRQCWKPEDMNAACKRLTPERHAQIKAWVLELNGQDTQGQEIEEVSSASVEQEPESQEIVVGSVVLWPNSPAHWESWAPFVVESIDSEGFVKLEYVGTDYAIHVSELRLAN